ncbi:ATP-binding cassette domain-containing protein [Listeria monocytogenes]|uniref:ATP-binding cassette domain-containing protein n=37 Tax=Listeria monocytogenes TaxID=1639 RepID=A0A3A7J968_LISMN|nr:ATP-binding cassette domain-containing protein [Listeria monocytogenes]EAD5052268.1 ATP-binding cassette domain-containing protein [Listeria monocytogenes serotype 4b]EHC5220528.1 ATP-binding cassette domain-containing protein [Listeria monocytogenes serotype 1/2b]HAA0105115.1 ATP-binding cassette domain-containing protein [Listeria monocytogenes CC70B]AAT03066.1 putative ABC transporter, ATP-binding protein [Listeria monocytogenes serotype 4b str. F2365]AGR12935.1 ATP-binding cassette doma
MNITKNGLYIIIGANGVGKTTLAKKILQANRSISCMMKQDDNQILEYETVLTNISMNEIAEKTVINFLEEHQLDYLITKKSKFLSGGEKRLVNLLRAILSNQEVLILDEPSNDLDIDVFEKAKQIIYQAAKSKIILLITHDDRFTEYDKKIEIKKNQSYEADSFSFNKESSKARIIKIKPRRTYFLYIFYLICMMIFAIFLVILLKTNAEETSPSNEKGTYQLATIYSTNASSYDNNEAINTMLIQSATKFNKAKFFTEETRINEDEYYEEAINLKKDTYQELIYLELYDPKTEEFINIKAVMMEALRGDLKLNAETEFISNDENYYKNSDSPSFHVPKSLTLTEIKKAKIKQLGFELHYSNTLQSNQVEIEFNPSVYAQILKKVNQQDVLITEAYVQLKAQESFYDFLAENKLYAKKIFIKGYEPELLNAEVNQYSNAVMLIKKVALLICLLLLVLLILLIMYEVSYKNSYSTLTYYGYNEKELLQFRKKTYLITNFKIFSVISTVIFLLIMWSIVHSVLITAIIGVVMIFFFFAYIVIPLIIKNNIRKAII